MQDIVIRKATAEDLADVKGWLEREQRETGKGFYCNWRVIETIFDEGMLDVLARGSETVAFVADGRSGPDIVEVRPDLRGRGFGRRAAEHALRKAYDRGNSVVKIECAPSTSIPFWKAMGFTMLVDPDGVLRSDYAFKTLPRKLEMPAGQPRAFAVKLYPQRRDWDKNTEPLLEVVGIGSIIGNRLHLPERVTLHDARIEAGDDIVIGVQVDGKDVFEDKAKTVGSAGAGCTT